jgi:hypothetical protein
MVVSNRALIWLSSFDFKRRAIHSADNQYRYLRAFTSWAEQKKVKYFYFSAFDAD